MGDHRLNVEIRLTGADGHQKKLDWWVNWWPDKAEILYKELVNLAIKAGLQVEDKTYLFDSDEDAELQRLRAENESLKLDAEWISVEDRLPENKQSVAFVVKSTHKINEYLDGLVLGGTYDDGCFYVPGCGFNASLWRPLTQPPDRSMKG